LTDLKGVCENLRGCATELKNIILDLEVEEGTLKAINDEFGANVAWLEVAMKAKVSQEADNRKETGAPKTAKETESTASGPRTDDLD